MAPLARGSWDVGAARLNVDIIESYESSVIGLLASLRDRAANDR